MFRFQKPNRWPPEIDTSCLRETLELMQADLKRVPQLRKAATALEVAIRELEAADGAAAGSAISDSSAGLRTVIDLDTIRNSPWRSTR